LAVDWDSLPCTRFGDLQAVNPNGSPAYSGGFPLRVQGVLLSDPGSIFDNSPNFIPVNWPATAFQFGGAQQPFVQSIDPNDVGGAAMFLAQSLGNHPANQDDFFSYTDQEWLAELARVNFDPNTGHEFQAGDLVEVRARIGLHFSGKFNINEAHDNSPDNDFDVILLQASYGLPEAQTILLSDVKDVDDLDIFDPTRTTGGERDQSQRVLLRQVTIVDPENWTSEEEIHVTDGLRTLPVLLGTNPDFDTLPAPAGDLDIIGIFDQEASVQPFGGLDGYRLIAISPADFMPAELCTRDINGDLRTDLVDAEQLVNDMGSTGGPADLDASGVVDLADFAILQVDYGCGLE
jgi:hypothetical protein